MFIEHVCVVVLWKTSVDLMI